MAWSLANRSVLLRFSAKRGTSTRVELRSPDPSCNPYLAFATILAACLDGVRNKIEPPKPVEANIYKLSDKDRKKIAGVFYNRLYGKIFDCQDCFGRTYFG